MPLAARRPVIGRLMVALIKANMMDHKPRRSALRAGLMLGADTWQDAARIDQLGFGTCPSIVAARVAELRKSGDWADWAFTPSGGLVVTRADGSREDPCKGAQPFALTLAKNAQWSPALELVSFETTPGDRKMRVICKMLDVLHEANTQWLRAGGKAPQLYDARIPYKEEELGHDEWQDIPETLARGFGDCEDLCSYRVSELRFAGENAGHQVEHRHNRVEGIVLYHILVHRGDGAIEDPSCRLGMSGDCQNYLSAAQVKQKYTREKQKLSKEKTGAVGAMVRVAPGAVTAEDTVLAATSGRIGS